MCGIAGFLDPSGALSRPAALARLQAMTKAIAHRGPDADGHHLEVAGDGAVWLGLGHRRLSIIDLSPAGAQPMESVCRRYSIVFNGEIYNFQELRASLEAVGSGPWRGHSDTEVLLNLIARHGVEVALQHCDGMFAFALLDRADRSLSLVRDAFGEKPLVYGLWRGVLLFGSELRALETWPGFAPSEDAQARAEMLQYSCVPAPATIYEGIFKLPPAHQLKLTAADLRNGALPTPRPWWDRTAAALTARATSFEGTAEAALAAVEETLSASVARRMVADVPLGALLSGGIDSSLTTALMQANVSRPVRTFTIGMDEPGYDESIHAEAVARHLGTDHQTLMLTPAEVQMVVPEVASIHDEPFADSSQLPTLLVARMARAEVTVVLSGDGGDELFAGYNRHFVAPRLWARLERLPAGLRRAAGAAILLLPPRVLTQAVRLTGPLAPRDLAAGRAGEKLHKLARLTQAPDRTAFHDLLLRTGDVTAVLAAEARPRLLPESTDPRAAELPLAEALMLSDAGQYLPDDVLTKVDRASMAVSLETRTPYLSRDLFDLAWSLPMQFKASNSEGKRILRSLLYRHVPRELVDRPKAGFAMPIGRWLRGPLADWVESLICPEALSRSDVFDIATVRRLWDEHRIGRRDHETMLWSILMYQAWHSHRRATAGACLPGNDAGIRRHPADRNLSASRQGLSPLSRSDVLEVDTVRAPRRAPLGATRP